MISNWEAGWYVWGNEQVLIPFVRSAFNCHLAWFCDSNPAIEATGGLAIAEQRRKDSWAKYVDEGSVLNQIAMVDLFMVYVLAPGNVPHSERTTTSAKLRKLIMEPICSK